MAHYERKQALYATLREPSFTAGEAEMLLFALDRSRAQFAWKTGGLDDEALHRAHPPSAMTIAGIVKHLAFVDDWTAVRLAATPMPEPWRSVDWDNDRRLALAFGRRRFTRGALPALARGAARCRAAVADVLADGGLDRPVKFTFDPSWMPNARRVLVDLHDEYARHVGHADLFREAIDGLVGEDPPPVS